MQLQRSDSYHQYYFEVGRGFECKSVCESLGEFVSQRTLDIAGTMKCNQGQNQTLIVKRKSCTFVTIMHFPIKHFPIMHFPSLFLPIMHFVIMHFAIVHFPIMHFPIVHFEFNSFFIHALMKIIVYLKDILALFNHTLSNLTVLSNLTPSATIMQNSEITQPLSET